jgi:hypothetical protein
MANRIWIGPADGDSNDWFVVDNWQTTSPNPPNYPQPGDTVTIATGGPSINLGDPSSALYDEVITLGSDSRSAPARITTTVAVTFGGNFQIQSIGTSAYAALQLSGVAVFNGTLLTSVQDGRFEITQADPQGVFVIGPTGSVTAQSGHEISFTGGTITNGGRLAALGGTLNLSSSGLQSLQGSGRIFLGLGGTLSVGIPVLAGQTVHFLDPNGFLYLSDPASCAARIVGFQPGNAIVLSGVLANQVSYDPVGEVLTVSDAGSVVTKLSLSGHGGPFQFDTRFDRFGGTIITSSRATRTWNGGSADWFAARNWTTTPPDVADFPLSGDRVRIPSGTAAITTTDVAQHGVLDVERITLASTDSAEPATLAVSSLTLGPNVVIETVGDRAFGQLQSFGTTTFNGLINASARHGKLIIQYVEFGDSTGILKLANLAGFGGHVLNFSEGNRTVT